jgi:hypothetical protein
MRIVRCTGSRVQIAPQPAATYKRIVFSYLESWICGGGAATSVTAIDIRCARDNERVECATSDRCEPHWATARGER